MGLSGGGGDGGAGQARADEAARQAKIRQGTQSINDIFDGYDHVVGADPITDTSNLQSGKYYLGDGSEYNYSAPPPAQIDPRTGKPIPSTTPAVSLPSLYSSTTHDIKPGAFNDDFYNGREQAFMDYATPQLNDQYADAQKQLTYSLDRAGTLDSSVRAQKGAELAKLYDTNRRQVADQALGYETQAKNNVEGARSDLINTLNATGDAEGAASSAASRASALSAPDTYSPLGQLFLTFTSGLGQQAAAEKSAALASSINSGTGGTSLFGTKKNAVTTTN